jgi:hypothetical protein
MSDICTRVNMPGYVCWGAGNKAWLDTCDKQDIEHHKVKLQYHHLEITEEDVTRGDTATRLKLFNFMSNPPPECERDVRLLHPPARRRPADAQR